LSKNKYIKSPINYTGNKYRLLDKILPLFPNDINRFIDLFGGSGTVLLNVDAASYVYNDINNYISNLFKELITTKYDVIIAQIEEIIFKYDLSKTNKEGFEKLRNDYNSGKCDKAMDLYVLMCYSFNYQFRFNNNHQYNSSFGTGRSCFTTRQKNSIASIRDVIKDRMVSCYSLPFEDFADAIHKGDFVYCDPPYLNSVGNYNDGKRGFEGWNKKHENNLRGLLDYLSSQGIKWALSNNIAYNQTLKQWAEDNQYAIHYLTKDYKTCNYHRKDKDSIEVLITNY